MPQVVAASAVNAAIAASVATEAAIASATFAGLTGAAAIAAQTFVVSAALGAVSMALAPSPTSSASTGMNLGNAKEPAGARKIVYGKVRTGGTYLLFNTTDPTFANFTADTGFGTFYQLEVETTKTVSGDTWYLLKYPDGSKKAWSNTDYSYATTSTEYQISFTREGKKNALLHILIALAGHEVDEISDIYYDDKKLGWFNSSDQFVFDAMDDYDNKGEKSPMFFLRTGQFDQTAITQLDDSVPIELDTLRDYSGDVINSDATTSRNVIREGSNALARNQIDFPAGRTCNWVSKTDQPEAAFEWGDDFKCSGTPLLYARLQFWASKYQSGLPKITAIVKGKRLYDPRESTVTAGSFVTGDHYEILTVGTTDYTAIGAASNTVGLQFTATGAGSGTGTAYPVAWSDNPALCILDYLRDSKYGMGVEDSEIDFDTFETAANTCDEWETLSDAVAAADLEVGKYYKIWTLGTTDWNAVAGTTGVTYALDDVILVVAAGSGTGEGKLVERKYTLNGVIDSAGAPREILESMLTALNGKLIYTNGTFKLFAFEDLSSYVASFDENNFVGPYTLSTAVSNRDLYNTVKGVYSDIENLYQPTEYPTQTKASYVTSDGREAVKTLDLPFTTSVYTAQRIASDFLLKSRQKQALSLMLDLSAIDVTAGDEIYITNERLGFSEDPFEVVKSEIGITGEGQLYVAVDCVTSLSNIPSSAITYSTQSVATMSALTYGVYEPVGAKAWVVFDGTDYDGSGVCTINASNNVTSVVRSSAGRYTVTFEYGFQDEFYSVVVTTGNDTAAGSKDMTAFLDDNTTTPTDTAFVLATDDTGGTPQDPSRVSITVFR